MHPEHLIPPWVNELMSTPSMWTTYCPSSSRSRRVRGEPAKLLKKASLSDSAPAGQPEDLDRRERLKIRIRFPEGRGEGDVCPSHPECAQTPSMPKTLSPPGLYAFLPVKGHCRGRTLLPTQPWEHRLRSVYECLPVRNATRRRGSDPRTFCTYLRKYRWQMRFSSLPAPVQASSSLCLRKTRQKVS